MLSRCIEKDCDLPRVGVVFSKKDISTYLNGLFTGTGVREALEEKTIKM